MPIPFCARVSFSLDSPTVIEVLDRLAIDVHAEWDWWPAPDSPTNRIVAHFRACPAGTGLRPYLPTIA